MPRALLILLCLSAAGAAQEPLPPSPPPGMARFRPRSGTFELDLPADWRQLAPREANLLRERIDDLPVDVARNEPALFYAIGPVDRWLDGDFDGRYLYVVEQGSEWVVGDDFDARLQGMWDDKGRHDGVRYELRDVRQAEIGRDAHPATLSVRETHRPGRTQQSLDVYAPTGGRQVTLSFTAWADDFAAWRPAVEQMLGSITFARRASGEATLGERLWTPLITGAVVGIALIVLYRWTRRRPGGPPPGLGGPARGR